MILRQMAKNERYITGRVGKSAVEWFRVRPPLATPKGRLP